jgi:choline kinase
MRPGKTTLVVMAAGLGSRFGGIKQLEPVGPDGETILEYSLFDARRAGFSEVVFIIRKAMEADFRSMLLDRIGSDLPVRLAYQETGFLPESWVVSQAVRDRVLQDRIKPWGTGHALWCARDSIDSNFAVINADDYYGARSFAILHDFLASTPAESDRYAMVGFELGKTLSDHGPVARGICGVDTGGLLTDIVEHTRLEALCEVGCPVHEVSPAKRIASTGADGSITFHSVYTPVSMNLFGFTPRFLPRLESLLCDFLAASAGDPGAEFYLPGAVQQLVKAGTATVRILHSPETWFGLTYRKDMDAVRGSLNQLIEDGVYPTSLRAPH